MVVHPRFEQVVVVCVLASVCVNLLFHADMSSAFAAAVSAANVAFTALFVLEVVSGW